MPLKGSYLTLNLKTVDLSQSASTSDIICDALRDAIIRGDIAEGQTLRQESIAQMFSVSRIPVREALKRLESQGLVTSVRHKGVVVASMSPTEIAEIFEFRALIEAKTIELSVPAMSDADLDRAAGYCEKFSVETNPRKWGDLNRLFHMSLYESSERPYYLEIISSSNDRVERYVRAQLELTEGMSRARSEHQAILDACAKRDAKQAARLTGEHIERAGAALIKFLQSHSEEF